MFKNLNTREFNSKLLLFGEYTVLTGSASLAIPFSHFTAKFSKNSNNNFSGVYQKLYSYLKIQNFESLGTIFRDKLYRNAFQQGLFFDANIPIGYGVGSSGAFSAALYHSFFKPIKDPSLLNLKNIFALIESFFHGQSSGIDPLIIYTNKAIYQDSEKTLSYFNFDASFFQPYTLALIDSGVQRSTAEFVEVFRKKITNSDYHDEFIQPLIKINNIVIEAMIEENHGFGLFDHYKMISSIQFNAFQEMIAPEIKPLWKNTLNGNDHLIKLCGAGGGGFYFLISKNISLFSNKFPDLKLITIL